MENNVEKIEMKADEINDIYWLALKLEKGEDNKEDNGNISNEDYLFHYSPDVSKETLERLAEQHYTSFAVTIEKLEYPMVFRHRLPAAQMAQVIEKPKMGMAIGIDLERYPASGNFLRYIADLTQDPVDRNEAAVIKYFLSLYLKKIDRSPGLVLKVLTLSNGRFCIYFTLGIILVAILVALISGTFS